MAFRGDLDGFDVGWVDDQVIGETDQCMVDADPEFAVSRRNALEIEEFRQSHYLHLFFGIHQKHFPCIQAILLPDYNGIR